MSDLLTDDTKAIILLCAALGSERSLAPLTNAEYNRLAFWLRAQSLRPKDMLHTDHAAAAARGADLNEERLRALLARGVQLGFAIEEWQRSGIWILSRSDPQYPRRYKEHLKTLAPPLLFGAGNSALLSGGGLAIVGSRNVDAEGERFAHDAATLAAHNQLPVIGGGARGVDHIAMSTALSAGGSVIGILAENLLKKSVERDSRHAIAAGTLLLLSPYHPTSRFSVEQAMERNKLIYAMADYALVVSAEHNKGGTWAGAIEELKRENAIPVFVRSSASAPVGNQKLLSAGARKWPERLNLSPDASPLKEQLAKLGSEPVVAPETDGVGEQGSLRLFD